MRRKKKCEPMSVTLWTLISGLFLFGFIMSTLTNISPEERSKKLIRHQRGTRSEVSPSDKVTFIKPIPLEVDGNSGNGVGAYDSVYDLRNLYHEASIRPEDSISNVASKTSSSLSRLRYQTVQKEIELRNKLKTLERRNSYENEKRDLQRRMEIEKAEEEAARLRREQSMKDRILEIQRQEEELLLQSQLSAAEEMNRIYVDSEISYRRPMKKTSKAVVKSPVGENLLVTTPAVEKETVNYYSPPPIPFNTYVQRPTPDITPMMNKSYETRPDVENTPTLTTILNKLVASQREQSLPPQDIESFSGTDVLDYPTFITNFKYVVEDRTEDHTHRLELLIKFTKCEARELIKQCPMIIPPSEAYKRARSLLDRDYGNPYILAAAFRNKAENWKKILPGDKSELKKFSLFLNNCVNVKMSNKDMTSMDSSNFITYLASRLPNAYQQRWISKVGDLRENNVNRPLTLEDFESFVGRISRNENDSRISKPVYQPKSQNRFQQTTHKVLSTQVDKNLAAESPCLYCDGKNHSLLFCRKFGDLTVADKSESVKKKGLCFGCLNPKHMKADCPHKDWVKCKKCERHHMTIMHDPSKDSNLDTKPKYSGDNNSNYRKPDETKPKISSGCVLANSNPLMAILPVLVKHKSATDCIATYAFVDNGSAAGFATSELAFGLKITGRTTNVTIKTLNSEQDLKTRVLENLEVGNLNEEFLDLPHVYVKDEMPVDICDAPTSTDLNMWEHLKHIKLPNICGYSNVIPKVTLMIGVNTPAATTPLEVRTGNLGEPYAVKSPLGWLLYGLPGKLSSTSPSISVNLCKIDQNLENQVKRYFDMEFCERLSEDKSYPSIEDKQFLRIMTDSIALTENHYETNLPFRDKSVTFTNNNLQAECFAYKLKNRLLKNDSLLEQYSAFMNNLEDKNYSEVVPTSEINRDDGRVWYIPHHHVINPKKPEKIRVVFNCPMKFKDYSLNNQLLQGPDLTNLLLGVLLRWRLEYFAIMGDIEQMFYQVRVKKSDCDVIRYIWWPNSDLSKPLTSFRMLVHPFGAVSSPSCANFALKQTALDNCANYSAEAVNTINNDFYVDDLLKSLPTETQCINIIKEVSDLLQKGGFRITKWISNSKKVLSTIQEQDLAEQVKDLDITTDALPAQRALGVMWKIETDRIEFSQNQSEMMNKCATCRNILSIISSIYDPLGIVSPFVLKAKIILQNLCREKLSWDEPIPHDCELQWNVWLKEIPDLDKLSINRCVKPPGFQNLVNTQLHHFSDASQEGYGSVSYLRFQNGDGDICVSFVMGRARVAPLKPHTIVKLELAAATSIVKINNMLTRELSIPINDVFFWSDSQTVLKYINNTKSRFQVFVANRMAIIHDGSNIDQWNYVPTKINPADVASRGANVLSLINNSMWINGPDFLKLPSSEWPEKMIHSESESDNVEILAVNAISVDEPCDSETVNKLIEKYSNWEQLKRGIAWWLRLKQILLCKVKNAELPENLCQKSLSLEEINESEIEIVKYVQKCNFSHEIIALSQNTAQVKIKSDISSLDPFIKDGLLRVGGRLRNAKVPYDAKHQIILPKDSYVSLLIVRDIHSKVGHQGKNQTISTIRKLYWIVKVGVLVKTVLAKCVMCRRYKSHISQQKWLIYPQLV